MAFISGHIPNNGLITQEFRMDKADRPQNILPSCGPSLCHILQK